MARTFISLCGAAGLAALALALPANSQSGADLPDISGITGLDVSAGMEVIYETAATSSIEVEILRGEREDVRIAREGNTLEIGRVRRVGWNNNRTRARITVTGPALETLDVSSGASVRASGIDAQAFTIDMSSGASLVVSGRCGALEIDASSGASLDAGGLECADGGIDASSGASIKASLTETVSVDASSGASVRIAGGASAREIERSSGASVRIEPAEL